MLTRIGCGSAMSITGPGNQKDERVASILSSYDYLLGSGITTGEAIRLLRLLRAAWKEAYVAPEEENSQ